MTLGSWREQWLKPATFLLLGLALWLLVALAAREAVRRRGSVATRAAVRLGWSLGAAGAVALVLMAAFDARLLGYMTSQRWSLDAAHFWVAAGTLGVALLVATLGRPASERLGGTWRLLARALVASVGLAVVAGLLMLLRIGGLSGLTRLAYFGFDLALALAALGTVAAVALLLAGARGARGVVVARSPEPAPEETAP